MSARRYRSPTVATVGEDFDTFAPEQPAHVTEPEEEDLMTCQTFEDDENPQTPAQTYTQLQQRVEELEVAIIDLSSVLVVRHQVLQSSIITLQSAVLTLQRRALRNQQMTNPRHEPGRAVMVLQKNNLMAWGLLVVVVAVAAIAAMLLIK